MFDLTRLLFPQKCFGCGKTGEWLCVSCQKLLPDNPYPICFKEGILDGVFSPFLYKREIKKIIHVFKFEMARELQGVITTLLLAEVNKTDLPAFWQKNKFILIPVPLHPYRQRWRGFNQSALIAEKLAESFHLTYSEEVLFRSSWRRPQVGLSQKKRQENIKNQFLAKKVEGKNFVVVDDVWTTGATLKEIAKILKQAGARLVWGITVCR